MENKSDNGNQNELNKNNVNQNESKQNDGKVDGLGDTPSLRLPGHFVMLTVDGMKDGKKREGGVGIKTGDKWNWMSYTDVKKIIDMCKVCKIQFNSQLELERNRAGVADL